jgi:hypothetical protein
MVNVFCEDSPFPLRSPVERFDGLVRRLAGSRMRSAIHRTGDPGASLDLVPEVPPRDDLAWAESNQHVARAFAVFSAVTAGPAAEHFSGKTLDVVREQIEEWDGDDPGLGGDVLSVPADSLDDAERVVAVLGLQTALASYRVDDDLVAQFCAEHPGEEPLVVLTSWVSLVAAQRIGTWLAMPME